MTEPAMVERMPQGEWSPGPMPHPLPDAVRSTQPRTTLPLRVEFARQISQWRVRGVLIVLAVLPIIIRLAFLIGGGGTGGGGGGGGTGGGTGGTADAPRTDFAAFAQASGTTFAAFVLVITGGFLLTLVVALLFGDMVAGEASRSTLKYLLTIPVGRARLLFVKVVVSATVVVVGVLVLTGMSLIVGTLSYGTDGIQVPVGPLLGLDESLWRILGAVALICLQLSWAASLGSLLTVCTDAPLAAAGGVVLVSIVSTILDRIDDLGEARSYLPTHNTVAFEQLFAARIDFAPIADSVLSALVYSLVFTVAAVIWFRRKNISS